MGLGRVHAQDPDGLDTGADTHLERVAVDRAFHHSARVCVPAQERMRNHCAHQDHRDTNRNSPHTAPSAKRTRTTTDPDLHRAVP